MPDDADYQRISHPCVAAAVEVSRIQSKGVPRNGSQSDGTHVMGVEMATAVATARCRRRFQSSMTPAWEGSRLGPPTQSQRPPSPGPPSSCDLPQPLPPRPARSQACVPTSSAPARLAPRAHRGAPRCARATRVSPARTRARSDLLPPDPHRFRAASGLLALAHSLDLFPRFGQLSGRGPSHAWAVLVAMLSRVADGGSGHGAVGLPLVLLSSLLPLRILCGAWRVVRRIGHV